MLTFRVLNTHEKFMILDNSDGLWAALTLIKDPEKGLMWRKTMATKPDFLEGRVKWHDGEKRAKNFRPGGNSGRRVAIIQAR